MSDALVFYCGRSACRVESVNEESAAIARAETEAFARRVEGDVRRTTGREGRFPSVEDQGKQWQQSYDAAKRRRAIRGGQYFRDVTPAEAAVPTPLPEDSQQ